MYPFLKPQWCVIGCAQPRLTPRARNIAPDITDVDRYNQQLYQRMMLVILKFCVRRFERSKYFDLETSLP